MATDEDIQAWSDSDGGADEQHQSFLEALSKLDKKKYVPPSVRKEPSLQVSEFHLSKEDDDEKSEVKLWQLAKTVSQKPGHRDVARKLKSIQRKGLTLPKPLEKPQANRIQREVGYDDVKTQLDVWEPIVQNNRAADHLVFPLNASSQLLTVSREDFLSDKRAATNLEKQFEEILHKDEPPEEEKEEEYALSLEEMVERRNELVRLRVRESYKHAKAHQQNKIKSKKYHRIARKERVRNSLKEFESLQQKDPEAALEKLVELEKERALERASLRHRSTGKWAKNQAVRAKYDKESRQILSEQLKLSKALTQKAQSDSDSNEEDETAKPDEPSDNPWVSSQTKTESEIDDFLSGYRKFWDSKPSLDDNSQQNKPSDATKKMEEHGSIQNSSERNHADSIQKAALLNAVVSYSETSPYEQESCSAEKKKHLSKAPSSEILMEDAQANVSHQIQDNLSSVMDINSFIIDSPSGKWFVTSTKKPKKTESASIHDLFTTLHDKVMEKTKLKINAMKEDIEKKLMEQQPLSGKRKKPVSKRHSGELLKMKKQRFQIDSDEKLLESVRRNGIEIRPEIVGNAVSGNIEQRKDQFKTDKSHEKTSNSTVDLDPNKFVNVKPVKLHNLVHNEYSGGHEGLDDSENEPEAEARHLTVSEAFEDDDVVAEFSKEKEDVAKQSKSDDIDLSLPGWGEWGGHKVKPNTRKRKRFIVKMPEAPPRKDANKGNLIINETEDNSARVHQVSDLPYPFTRVRDFEASIRAPISGTFIPQSAHRKLIKPAVLTKSGTIISPMDKSVLLNKRGKSFKAGEHIKLDHQKKKKKQR